MEIVIASNNKHKIDEFKKIFAPFNIEVLSLKDVGINCNPEEDGKTFKDNSLIKALSVAKLTDKVVLADDSGLIVDALPDILGVETSRFMGEDTPYFDKCTAIINMLEGKDRTARYICCITIVNLEKEPLVFQEEVVGQIDIAYRVGKYGFGYDPIFIPEGYNETFATLSDEIKHAISHRGKAGKKMVEYFKEKF